MDEYAIEATEFQEQLCVQKRPLTIIKRNNGLDLNYFMDPGLTCFFGKHNMSWSLNRVSGTQPKYI